MDTIVHLESIGVDLSSRVRWKGIKNIVAAFGFDLEDSGVISAAASKGLEHRLIANYVSALLAVSEIEREHMGLTEEQLQYIEEVEFYLKASKPDVPMQYRPSVMGHSNRTHSFHFNFDGWLIDASKPHGSRTGSILRKSTDVLHGDERVKIMVIMDDRDDPERAKIETDILTALVSVLQFSDLRSQSEGGRVKH